MKFCGQSARFKTGFIRGVGLVALIGCWAIPAFAEPVPETAWRVVITGPLQPQNAQTQPIPGAKATWFAAAGAGHILAQEEFRALNVDWAAFRGKAGAAANLELAGLNPEWIRDRNAVIECAIFHSQRPSDDITVAIGAPDFLARFTPLFGRKMLLAIPDRHTAFLFPKLASRYQAYAERVLTVYKKSECPVSREVFELSAEGLRAIGAYAE